MALGGICDWGFFITLGDCGHLAGWVLVEIVEHHLVVVRGLRSVAIVRGIVFTPREIHK